MDIEQVGELALAELARQTTVQEPLIEAILATRSCLGAFRLLTYRQDLDTSRLEADQPLYDQLPQGAKFTRDLAINSLLEAHAELEAPGRVLIFPCRNPSRLCDESTQYRAVGAFDYEVRNGFRSPCHFWAAFQEQEGLGLPVAAILEWPEDWDAEWVPTDLQLCNRLRMLIVQAFRGEAYLIARRESESGQSPRIENRLRTLEWREKVPDEPEPRRINARKKPDGWYATR